MATESLICWACHNVNDPTNSNCPNCGEAVTADVRDMTRVQIKTLSNKVTRLQGEVDRLKRKLETFDTKVEEVVEEEFSWFWVPESEKWSMAWGVFWRLSLGYLGIGLLLFFAAAAIGD